MDDGAPGLEVGFLIDTGESFTNLSRLDTAMATVESKVLAEAKSADFHAVPLCACAHRELHQIGLQTWQAKYKINHAEQGRAYGRQSPKRALWAHIEGAPR